MNCVDIQEKIIDLLLDDISPQDKFFIQEHLKSCPICREELRFLNECLEVCTLKETETCVCQFQETYWNEFVVSVHEKITHEKIERKFPSHIVIPIAASAIAVIVFGYLIFFRPSPQETAQESQPGYEASPYEEIYELTPEQQEEFIRIINQRYGE